MRKLVYSLSLVLIFTIPWEGAVQSQWGTVSTVMAVVVSAAWLALLVMTGHMRKPNSFLHVMSIFVVWIALTVFWSADPSNSMGAVLRWIESLIFVFVLWDLYQTRREVLAGLQAFVLGTYVAIAGAFVNYHGANAYYTHYQRFSPGNTNPDGFGFTVALAVPMACYLAAAPETSKRARLINLAYLPVGFLGLALSGTRTASVASVVGLLFGLALLMHLKPSARLAIVATVIAAMVVVFPIVKPLKSFERFGTTGTEITQGDLNGRTGQWLQGLSAFSEHPLFGVGTDEYRSINTLDKVAHNTFVSVLVELGLVGFVLFMTLLWIAFRSTLTQPKWDKWYWITQLAVWGIGASTLTYEHRKTTWAVLGLCVAAASVKREPARPSPAQTGRPVSLAAGERGLVA